jgi:putative spermidine/putrescine transport system substrate-binding protein
MDRRQFLKTTVAAGALTAAGSYRAFAADRPMTFVSWGGALSDMETKAIVEPFAAMTGQQVVSTSPTEYAKIKAMVQAGNVEWDVVTVGGRFAYDGADEGLLEEIDYARVPNAAKLEKSLTGPYGVATSLGATIIAWNTDAITEAPESWADFWDVARRPGARGLYKHMYYNYEAALRAAGLSEAEMYPVTDETIEIMFGKMAEIKPHVTVWWGSGAQPPQLLSSGELAMSSAWDGRIKALKGENAPVAFTFADGIAWGNVVVVPKGTPYRDAAMDMINYAVGDEAQTVIANSGNYAPVLSSAAEATPPDIRAGFASAPENLSRMVLLNEQQAALYMNKYTQRWQEFQLG